MGGCRRRFKGRCLCVSLGFTSEARRFTQMNEADLLPLLLRIAEALDRLAPAPPPAADLDAADAFVWHTEYGWLEPVGEVHRVEIGLLRGIDRVRGILLDNTRRFAAGLPARCCGGRVAPARARS
jgi:predicted AAA+ superfamily ATPase